MIPKLRTVDIWDTVLRRRCHPDAVKLETARKLILRQGRFLAPAYQDSWALLHLRCAIEGELACAATLDPLQDDEYILRDVLTAWVIRAAASPCMLNISPLVEELENEEFRHEEFVSYVDPEIRNYLAESSAEKTVFLSDFYMSAEKIFSLLEAKDVAGLFDGGLSSSDHKLNKRSGRLFKLVQSIYAAESNQHLHIGDNPISDYAVPTRLAIKAVQYAPREESARSALSKDMFLERSVLYQAIDRECRESAPKSPEKRIRSAVEYGITLAPLFIGHAQFILESTQRDELDKLFFFTREGEFFARVYEALRAASSESTRFRTPAGSVLSVSRIATFAASLKEFSVNEMMRLWSLYGTQSMKALAQSLNYPLEAAAQWCSKHHLSFEEAIRNPWQQKMVQQFFADPEIQASLQIFITGKRALLLEYLKEQGLTSNDRKVGIVDIGWRGSIQDNIALLMPDTRFSGYYLGLQKFLNKQPSNTVKTAYGPNLNTSPDHSKLFGKLSLIEMLTNSPNGSTLGYERALGGGIASIHLNNAEEDQAYHDYTSHIQAGVLHAARIWANYIHAYAVSSVELRTLGLSLWAQLIRKPPQIVREAHSKLQHNELFGLGSFVQKRKLRPFSISGLLRIWK